MEPPSRAAPVRERTRELRRLGVQRLRRAAGSVLPRRWAGAILMYHRIAAVEQDPLELCVHPSAFREHLDVLQSEFRVIPLRELLAAVDRRRPVRRAVAITFDDGYRDNLITAAPELERRALPATLYVATGFVGGREPFWWDELQALLTGRTDGAGDRLELELDGVLHAWATDGAADRAALLRRVIDVLRTAPADRLADAIATVRAWAGRPDGPATEHLGMDHAELGALASSDLWDIGAHTRRHCGLHRQRRADAEEEIAGSRDDLTAWLGRPPASFSYPFGDWSYAAARAVRDAGFASAVTIRGATPVTLVSHRLALPRVPARDEPGAALAATLHRLLG